MWNLEYDANEPVYKTETDSQMWKINLWFQKRKAGDKQRINRYTALYIK